MLGFEASSRGRGRRLGGGWAFSTMPSSRHRSSVTSRDSSHKTIAPKSKRIRLGDCVAGEVIYHSPLTTHHSSLITHHSPLTTHHSPLTTHHSPLTALFSRHYRKWLVP